MQRKKFNIQLIIDCKKVHNLVPKAFRRFYDLMLCDNDSGAWRPWGRGSKHYSF